MSSQQPSLITEITAATSLTALVTPYLLHPIDLLDTYLPVHLRPDMFFGKAFAPDTDIPDLSGKVFLVTGGNTGIGEETIFQLAKHSPSHIYLAARTPAKAESAIASLKSRVPSANISFLPLDLSSFASIKSAAAKFVSSSSRLDVLVNNAGIMAVPSSMTEDGFEIQFGTNHVGHAYLTSLLLPTLLATAKLPGADVRVVTLSSTAYNLSPKPLVLDQTEAAKLSPWARYGQSKMANVLFAMELAKRQPEITAVSLHPGIIKSDLWEANRTTSPMLARAIDLVSGVVMDSVEFGARNTLWCATAKKDEIKNGAFYKPVGKVGKVGEEEAARELWEWTGAEIEKRNK